MKNLGVQSLPLHKPVIMQKGNTLRQAALAMKRNNVGSVLVSDGEGFLRGLFTDRDLALSLAIDQHAPSESLENTTTERLIYVTENASLQDVVNTMIKFSIRKVPVVHLRPNGKQRCLGIITLDDLVKNKLIDPKDEAKILSSQLKTPKEKMGRSRLRRAFSSLGQHGQSYHTFAKTVVNQTSLTPAKAQILTTEVLVTLLKRLPAKQGQKLLSQLPYEIQMQMSPAISAPDRSITGAMLLSQIKKSLHVDADEAKFLLERFWESLESSVTPGEIRILSREIPKDFMSLFIENSRQ